MSMVLSGEGAYNLRGNKLKANDLLIKSVVNSNELWIRSEGQKANSLGLACKKKLAV